MTRYTSKDRFVKAFTADAEGMGLELDDHELRVLAKINIQLGQHVHRWMAIAWANGFKRGENAGRVSARRPLTPTQMVATTGVPASSQTNNPIR